MTTSATDRFFETLAGRGHEPLLEKASGSVRFDLSHGQQTDHWMVRIRHGDLEVSREESDADSVVRASRTVFEQFATGQMNAFAALLRGQASAEGNLELPVLLQRLLPGPPRNKEVRPEASPTPPPGAVATAGAHAGAGAHGTDVDSGRR
jgi:putative sterol carrier protein